VRVASLIEYLLYKDPYCRCYLRYAGTVKIKASERLKLDISPIPEPELPLRSENTKELQRRLKKWVKDWAKWLSSEEKKIIPFDPEAIVTDLSPMPLILAKRLRIPGFFLGHFNWFEEYAPLVEITGITDEIAEAYEAATVAFVPPISSDNTIFPIVQEVPLITFDLDAEKVREKRKNALGTSANFIAYIDHSLFTVEEFESIKSSLASIGKIKWFVGDNGKKLKENFALMAASDLSFIKANYTSISFAIRAHIPFVCIYSPNVYLEEKLVKSLSGYGFTKAIKTTQESFDLAQFLNKAHESFHRLPDLLRLDGRQFIWEKLKEI